jgi:predicted nucleotidyltransferase component of viral defense system
MLNQYSDIEEEGDIIIQSYGLEEIVIEKMAALMGRTIPRDLYDFDYLTNTVRNVCNLTRSTIQIIINQNNSTNGVGGSGISF